jgi:hypothetical protein
LYPQRSWEELGGTFLGQLAYLDAKARGDKSMPREQRPTEGVQDGALHDPRDMVKARLLEAQCPAVRVRTHRNDV